jgi:hypothetical protein
MRNRPTSSLLLLLPALSLLAGAALAELTVIRPYGAPLPEGTPGYRYTILPLDSSIPGFELPGFDDSLWSTGAAPFGAAGPNPEVCPQLWPAVQTDWIPFNSDLFVRFDQELCLGTHSVRVGVSIDNDVALWVNGFEVDPTVPCVESPDGLCMTEECAFPDKVVFEVPDAYLLAGDNLFAVHARDRHIVAFFDIEIQADISTVICPLDNDPPACDDAFAGDLWPPNHKMRDLDIQGVVDPEGDEIIITIDSIVQDEPTDARGNGDGNTCPDGDGIGTGVASVRAERAGGGDGRVYHVGFTATAEGGSCQGTVQVCVPHDQGGGSTCIDQGGLFDSTACD